jgi:adenylate cyclase
MPANRSKICMGCWQQLHLPVPLRGVASVPFRIFGIRPSRMNPNTCTICEMMFTKVMRASKITIDVTVLFADLRNYTALSETLAPEQMSSLLDVFYDECAAAIWAEDGLLNKTIGDAVMAVFNFPIKSPDHPLRAIAAAREIQRRCAQQFDELAEAARRAGLTPGIGIGIDSGLVSFGEFGRSHRDLTAIGTVVNTAARAQGVAQPGEILVSQTVRERSGPALAGAGGAFYALKGLEQPVELFTV